MSHRCLTCCAVIALAATAAFGAGTGDILGIWKTDRDESKVEIFRCGEKLCGKIIWLKKPYYTDSSEGEVGTPVLERKNPDSALKSRPILGLRLLEGFTEAADSTWGNGTCYDPRNGKTYRAKLHLVAPGRLELRGYMGIPLLGRSTVWAR